jgi:hypothetical protein
MPCVTSPVFIANNQGRLGDVKSPVAMWVGKMNCAYIPGSFCSYNYDFHSLKL